MLLKIISFILIIYLLYRLFGVFFRALFMVMGKRFYNRVQDEQRYRQQQNQRSRRPDGSIKIDHEPPKDHRKQTDFKGGEYIDYEEVDK